MVSMVLDIFNGSVESTSQVIGNDVIVLSIIRQRKSVYYVDSSHCAGFAVLYLTHHPQVQLKMQAELDAVCGHSLPTLAMRSR